MHITRVETLADLEQAGHLVEQRVRPDGTFHGWDGRDVLCHLAVYGGGQLKARVSSLRRVSWAHSAQGDVAPDGLALRSDLSIGGGSEEMSTRTEMVANGAERPQEALGVLG